MERSNAVGGTHAVVQSQANDTTCRERQWQKSGLEGTDTEAAVLREMDRTETDLPVFDQVFSAVSPKRKRRGKRQSSPWTKLIVWQPHRKQCCCVRRVTKPVPKREGVVEYIGKERL